MNPATPLAPFVRQRCATAAARSCFAALLALLALLLGPIAAAVPGAPAADAASDTASADAASADPSLVRITSSFDVTHAAAVLRQVGKLFHAGFLRKDADGVAKEILALPAEDSRLWSFTVVYKGSRFPLQIRARLDDFGMLDLDFFSTPAVAGVVRGAVDGYLNSRGL